MTSFQIWWRNDTRTRLRHRLNQKHGYAILHLHVCVFVCARANDFIPFRLHVLVCVDGYLTERTLFLSHWLMLFVHKKRSRTESEHFVGCIFSNTVHTTTTTTLYVMFCMKKKVAQNVCGRAFGAFISFYPRGAKKRCGIRIVFVGV